MDPMKNPAATPPALASDAVTKNYGRRVPIPTTIRVPAGENLAIVGPSGCGKTTLLLLLGGLLDPSDGVVFQNGELVSRPGWQKPPRERHLGFVFQELALWPHMTVREHLEFALGKGGGSTTEGDAERISLLLKRLSLQSLESHRPQELSGGERQRLGWARAIISEPDLLLLDEPLTSLDPALRSELLEATLQYGSLPGRSVVVVTHDEEVAASLGGQVLRLGST